MARGTALVSGRFQGILDTITRVRGVRGAMIVACNDGLVVADSLMEGVRGNAVAALASSLIKHAANATAASGAGAPQFLHLQGSRGALLAVSGRSEILIVAVAEPSVNVGLVRLELIRAAEAVN
jgi:predicted regulator of Ras-like GTPase activity (Roadblock/LC7/MglB family)